MTWRAPLRFLVIGTVGVVAAFAAALASAGPLPDDTRKGVEADWLMQKKYPEGWNRARVERWRG